MRNELCEFRWLRIPYARVRQVILDHRIELLEPAASSAVGHSREVLATIDADIAGRHVERDVTVAIGDVLDIGAPLPILRLPLKWHAVSHPELYPVMDGMLEAYPIAGDRTQLSLQGTYQPPFGKLGEVLDSVVLHRVAEAAVEHFLEAIAERIVSQVEGPAPNTEELPLVEPEDGEQSRRA